MQKKTDVFISYRREGGFETANLLFSSLKSAGYRVFLDLHALHAGDFSDQLRQKVKECKDFIWVLSPTNIQQANGMVKRITTLEYREGIDYFRDEICWAIQYGKNIIPVILDDFTMPSIIPPELQAAIDQYNPTLDLRKLQAVVTTKNQYFDASMKVLRKYLKSHAVVKWRILAGVMVALAIIATVFFPLSQRGGVANSFITLSEAEHSSLPFYGASVELIVGNKSQGVKQLRTLDEQAVFTDISLHHFGRDAVVRLRAEGFLPQNDTLKLSKNIHLSLIRDDSYRTYFGHVGDSRTGLPLKNVRITIGDQTVYTDSLGHYSVCFGVGKQTISKSLSAYKAGYELHEDNETFPGSDNKFYLDPTYN